MSKFDMLFSPSGEHNAPLDTSGMVEGTLTVKGHVPGTDPVTDLALFADGLTFAGAPEQTPLVANIRAVLARLERAESIAKAATALVALSSQWDMPTWHKAFHALAEEVQRDAE